MNMADRSLRRTGARFAAAGVCVVGIASCGYSAINYLSVSNNESLRQSQAELASYIAAPESKNLDDTLSVTYSMLEKAETANPNHAETIAKIRSDITSIRKDISADDNLGPGVAVPVADSVKDSIDSLVNTGKLGYFFIALTGINMAVLGLNIEGIAKRIKQNREEDERAARREQAYFAQDAGAGRHAREYFAGRPGYLDMDAADIAAITGRALVQPAAPARNTEARENDNNIWTNKDNDEDANQRPKNTRRRR
jgi:hypothetical protein